MALDEIHDRTTDDIAINSQVTVAVVSDPYSETGEKIKVTRSLRDDPLAAMYEREQIDDAQFAAGRKWQLLHGKSTIGSIKAIDPGKEAVDGGIMSEPITDMQIAAFQELAKCAGELGFFGNRLVFAVLGEGKQINEAAREFRLSADYEVRYLGRRFRECLETMAIFWQFAAEKYRG